MRGSRGREVSRPENLTSRLREEPGPLLSRQSIVYRDNSKSLRTRQEKSGPSSSTHCRPRTSGLEFSRLIVLLVPTAIKAAVTENSPIRSCQRDRVAQNYDSSFSRKFTRILKRCLEC